MEDVQADKKEKAASKIKAKTTDKKEVVEAKAEKASAKKRAVKTKDEPVKEETEVGCR